MKLTVKSVAAIVAAISISAYGIAVYNTPRITSIHTEAITSLNKGEQGILEIGFETQRGFSAEKSAAAFNKLDFEWETSDENVVTVNDGTVTAVGKGSAIITVTSGQLKAQAEVVVHIPPEDIKADPIVLDTRSGWKDIAYIILPEEKRLSLHSTLILRSSMKITRFKAWFRERAHWKSELKTSASLFR